MRHNKRLHPSWLISRQFNCSTHFVVCRVAEALPPAAKRVNRKPLSRLEAL